MSDRVGREADEEAHAGKGRKGRKDAGPGSGEPSICRGVGGLPGGEGSTRWHRTAWHSGTTRIKTKPAVEGEARL